MTLLLVGCGGSRPEAETAASAPESATEESSAPAEGEAADTEAAPKHDEDRAPAKASASSDDKGGGDASASPQFPEGATVAQAMAAVPKGTVRANIDEQTLGEPLQQPSLYEPCKVGTQHFKLKVAIWDGQAVGVDVTTSNKALATCIERQVRGTSWPHKVKSLNTVEYSM